MFVFFNQVSVLNKSADIGFSWDLFSPISFRNARYTTTPLFSEVLRQGNCGTNKKQDQNPAVSGFSNGPKVQLKPFEARENPPMIQSQQIGGSGLVV